MNNPIMKIIPNVRDVIPYTYEELKEKDDFEVIIQKHLKSVASSDEPTFVHMLGIPAAGKSTFYKNNIDKFKNYLFISFDAIMEQHPLYQRDVEELGSVEAFSRWEIPARIAGYELLSRAVEAKVNIFMDHSGAPQCHQVLLKNVQKQGYKTQMFYIQCPVDIAIARAKEREMITKRHTPEKLITERIVLIEKNVEIYKSIVDEFVYV